MSCSKGGVNRTRPQKHQNRMAFKNDLHDKSVRTKQINSTQHSGTCSRCRDIIQWKIKYKKYKPLTAPKKCVKCDQKSVKQAYHVMCPPCARQEGICAKCLKKEEIIELIQNSKAEEEELQQIIKALPERKRRTFLRYIKRQSENTAKKENGDDDLEEDGREKKIDLAEKINKLKLEAKQNEGIQDYDSDFVDSDCSESFDNSSDELDQ